MAVVCHRPEGHLPQGHLRMVEHLPFHRQPHTDPQHQAEDHPDDPAQHFNRSHVPSPFFPNGLQLPFHDKILQQHAPALHLLGLHHLEARLWKNPRAVREAWTAMPPLPGPGQTPPRLGNRRGHPLGPGLPMDVQPVQVARFVHVPKAQKVSRPVPPPPCNGRQGSPPRAARSTLSGETTQASSSSGV